MPIVLSIISKRVKMGFRGFLYIVFCLHDAFYAFEVILEAVSHMIVSVADVTGSTCYFSHIPI